MEQTKNSDAQKAQKSTFFLSQWKTYHTLEQIKSFVKKLTEEPEFKSHIYYIALPFIHLKKLSLELKQDNIVLGSATIQDASPGSFTESNAASLLKAAGAHFVLIGTSGYRKLFHESNASINYKIKKVLEAGLTPFLCVGESLEETLTGKSYSVIKNQFEEGLQGLTPEQLASVVIVYEAPWQRIDQNKASRDKVLENYEAYRKALRDVVGESIYPQMSLVDALPEETDDLRIFLDTIYGSGLYAHDPELFFELLHIKKDWELPHRRVPAYPPSAPPSIKTVNEEPAKIEKSEKQTFIAPKEAPVRSPIDLEEDEEARIEELEEEPVENEDLLEQQEPLPQEEFLKEESTLSDEIEEDASKEVLAEESDSEFIEDEWPAPSVRQEEKALSPSEKLEEEEILDDLPPGQSFKSSSDEEDDEENFATPPAPLKKAEEHAGLSLEDLEEKREKMQHIEHALKSCYSLIREKGELLPNLRNMFPERLSKMTADLNQLSPELQEKINKGEVAYFTQNPDKAKEAEHVLIQLKELNQLLQQTASIPRDIDRLQSKGKELRKDLETAWAFFNSNRRKIKDQFSEYSFPQQPEILLEKAPTIDFAPPSMATSNLTNKKFAVVKSPQTPR